jgi:hypothetical protein
LLQLSQHILQSAGVATLIPGDAAARYEIKEEDCLTIKHEPMEEKSEVNTLLGLYKYHFTGQYLCYQFVLANTDIPILIS